MGSWKKVITQMVSNAEEHFDRLKYRLKDRLGNRDPLMIQTYLGYGTPEKLYLKGRVLEDKGITPADDNDSIWENLLNMYRRFESDEVPHARLRARFQDVERVVQTDEEGFFEIWIEPSGPLDTHILWQEIQLELIDPVPEDGKPVTATGKVFVPPSTARFGVISDVDDTVVKTDVAHVLRMARNVFLANARTRLPFKGVAAFYRALFNGSQGMEMNPLFYVSSSPWNLYDLLCDFFLLQDIPNGPILFLRDWGINENELLPTGHASHKIKTADQILSIYKDLPFILVGDSGQEDPEIYEEIVRRYPKRILAVYIRNVSRSLKRPEAIRKLAEKVVKAGSTLILADDTLPMAQHAYDNGWIAANSFPDIVAETAKDEAPPSQVDKLLGEKEAPQETAPTVVVEHSNPVVVEKAIEGGAIETALDETTQELDQPPTVIVKGDQDKAPGEGHPQAKPPEAVPPEGEEKPGP